MKIIKLKYSQSLILGYSGQADPLFRSKVTPMGMAVISSRQ